MARFHGLDAALSLRKIVLGFLLITAPDQLLADDDLRLASEVLAELGAEVPNSTQRCSSCHGMSARQIEAWGNVMQDTKACISKQPTPWIERLRCLFIDIYKPELGYTPKKLGLWAAKPRSPEFEALFREAYKPDIYDRAFRWFVNQTQMPPHGNNEMSDEAFQKLRDWVGKGMPHLYTLLPEPPSLGQCTESYPASLKNHIRSMQQYGWAARNRENAIKMAACKDNNPLNCFSEYTDARNLDHTKTWAERSSSAAFRIVVSNTSIWFWIRSSPDGRFIGTNGKIHDLGTATTAPRTIMLDGGNLDPNFSPDSSGFSYLNDRERPVFCPYHLLQDPSSASLNLRDYPCQTYTDMDAYLYLGSSLDGNYQLAVSGSHENDPGRSGADPKAYFTSGAVMRAYVLRNNNTFERVSSQSISTPYAGDWALSQSGKLAAGRQTSSGQWNSHNGYELKFTRVSYNGSSSNVSLQDAGKVCMRGAKANFSYDERFIVTHHEVAPDEFREYGFSSANDPAFKSMRSLGTTNIFLVDLLTGAKQRITTMEAGQKAVFPHFRSDGWIYFAVQDSNKNITYIVATDAALKM